ncbi:MAG TPA: glycosyltransferase family 1 protein [Thermoanaerobaculia bacterium]|nr:glycosyltransferase family 1 protein [Thermoanaerobaculia bacterium]
MRVLIDGRSLVPPRSGIGVHTAEIAGRLAVDPPPLIAAHAEIANKQGIANCRFRVDRAPNGILWQQLVLPRIDADVLWGPFGTIPLTEKIPSVVTLHDFSSLTTPGRHRIRTILSFNIFITSSLERAKRIAAVSRAIADEAMRWFGVPRRQIEIVPNGVDEFFQPADGSGDYILFVGTLEPRKGIEDLVSVWWSLPEPRPPLMICGDRGWRVRVPDGVGVTGWVDRDRLRELYQRARIFVYPSRYEGFGIPPLEAMACGAPVVATRVGAIGEYAKGAAMLVDPGDRDGLRAAILRLLTDEPLRRELRERGIERAKQYRWDRSAALMQQLLIEAASR